MKKVINITHNGDLYRVVYEKRRLKYIRVYERGLTRGWELDWDEVPRTVKQLIVDQLK